MFLRSTPWDGAPEGRLSVILQNTPTKERHKVGVHLNGYNVFYSVLGEVHQPPAWKQAQDADPLAFVLFGRYRDNVCSLREPAVGIRDSGYREFHPILLCFARNLVLSCAFVVLPSPKVRSNK